MAFMGNTCTILDLPAEQLENLCSYLTPDSVCQLEQTCSQLQERMDQERIWKKQVESFPVPGIPFGDSSEATFSKLRKRWDYFNQSLLNFFTEELEPEWDNPNRVALRVKFTLDKLLGNFKHFVENNLDDALSKRKEDATQNPDTDMKFKYPLKTFQVEMDLDEPHKWNFECFCYLRNWMVHGRIFPDDTKAHWMLSNKKNVFKIETYVYHQDLVMDESESGSENNGNDDGEEGLHDDEEEENAEGFNAVEEEKNLNDLE